MNGYHVAKNVSRLSSINTRNERLPRARYKNKWYVKIGGRAEKHIVLLVVMSRILCSPGLHREGNKAPRIRLGVRITKPTRGWFCSESAPDRLRASSDVELPKLFANTETISKPPLQALSANALFR